MAHFLVSVPLLRIRDTYIEATRPSLAARRVIDEHDYLNLSLRCAGGVEVIVMDEWAKELRFMVKGTIRNSVRPKRI